MNYCCGICELQLSGKQYYLLHLQDTTFPFQKTNIPQSLKYFLRNKDLFVQETVYCYFFPSQYPFFVWYFAEKCILYTSDTDIWMHVTMFCVDFGYFTLSTVFSEKGEPEFMENLIYKFMNKFRLE